MIWSSKEKGARQVARILLIEDNNDIQEILYSLLSEDHEVLQAFQVQKGCGSSSKKALIWSFSILCFQGKMAIRSWRRSVCRVKCRVIMMTALGDKHLISQYLLAGANDYIVKPFNLDEVAARVTVQLRNQPTVAQELNRRKSYPLRIWS